MSVGVPEKLATRQPPARRSEALGAKLDHKVRAFADHLAKAVAESVLRDIRAGRCGIIKPKPGEGGGEPKKRADKGREERRPDAAATAVGE